MARRLEDLLNSYFIQAWGLGLALGLLLGIGGGYWMAETTHARKLKVGIHVCAKQCPSTCDLVIKEIVSDDAWTEPSCSGPVGFYPLKDLWVR